MITKKLIIKFSMLLSVFAVIASCSDKDISVKKQDIIKSEVLAIEVYKSPTCGCCQQWIDHLDENGFQTKVHEVSNISIIKDEKGIQPRYRSCHTAISSQGYLFEGHIPAKFISQFLNESHDNNVLGLSVPAMPVGSPGMEVDDKFQPYKILLLKSDGSNEIYADIQSYKEQF